MRIDFRIVKCECGEIHIPARDGEPCGQCRYEARKFFVPPKELCGDQGAMIAWNGILAHKSGFRQSVRETDVRQRWRTDEVDITWRKG